MKISANSSFIRYDLTEEEIAVGFHFNSEQRAVIQNLIADYAEEKLTLTYSPAVLQAEAELQGKIGILKYLLSLESQLNPEVN